MHITGNYYVQAASHTLAESHVAGAAWLSATWLKATLRQLQGTGRLAAAGCGYARARACVRACVRAPLGAPLGALAADAAAAVS